MKIVNIADPSNIFVEYTIPTAGNADGMDMANGYVAVAMRESGVDIIDVDPPGSASVVAHVDTTRDAWEVYIKNDYIYAAVGTGLDIIDITDPASAYIYDTLDTSGYVYDVAVTNGYAFMASDIVGLEVYDVDPIDSPTWIGNFPVPFRARTITVIGTNLYLTADGDPGGIKILALP